MCLLLQDIAYTTTVWAFRTGLVRGIRNKSFAIMLSTAISRSVKEIDLRSNQEENFIQRSCWVYDGIFKELSIMKSETIIQQSTLISISSNIISWKQLLDRKYPSLVNRKEVILHQNNAHSHTAQMTKDRLEEISW